MRKTLHTGSYRIEILEKDDSLLVFRDISSAVAFLRGFVSEPHFMATMREVVAAHSSITHPLNAEEVIHKLATLLVNGQIKIIRTFEVRASKAAEAPAQPEGQGGQGRKPAEKSWIEIYLRDMEGQPVPGKKYRVKLPDGSVEEGNLDSFGHAEWFGINSGTCLVAFPEYDSEAWEVFRK